jgi:hypothetical protein
MTSVGSGLAGGGSCTLVGSGASASCSESFSLPAPGAGTYSIQAAYGGDAQYSPASATTSVAASPAAGVTADVSVLQGTVSILVKSARDDAGDSRAPAAETFVPLKGETVSVPVGSTVDTRKGVVRLTTASDYRPASDPAHTVQAGTFSASIFTIEQLTKKQAAKRAHLRRGRRLRSKPSTDLMLGSPPAAARRAGCRRVGRPGTGVVRSFSGTAKGFYRTIGAASVTTIKGRATWVIKDRCDGTLTEVGRGRAIVTPKRPGRTHQHSIVVLPGQGVLIKGRFL